MPYADIKILITCRYIWHERASTQEHVTNYFSKAANVNDMFSKKPWHIPYSVFLINSRDPTFNNCHNMWHVKLYHVQYFNHDLFKPQKAALTVQLLEFCDWVNLWDWARLSKWDWEILRQIELNMYWPTT